MIHELTFQTILPVAVETALEKVTTALKNQGFGILTRIDVQDTFKQKLGVDFRPYLILGACNPTLAHRALRSEPMAGALLPCNVTLERSNMGTLISIINPEAMLGIHPLADNPVLREVAQEARERLEQVLVSLKA